MKNESYAKYPPCNERDEDFGMYITTCGYSKVHPGTKYPPREHPSSYMFSWENGRVLQDYQFIYITRGEGLFESKSSSLRRVTAGSTIIVFPDEWHRYKPIDSTGWNEYWIGFKGATALMMEKKHFIKRSNRLRKESQRLDCVIIGK